MKNLSELKREDILGLGEDDLEKYITHYIFDNKDVSNNFWGEFWDNPSLCFLIRDSMHQRGFGSEDRVMSSSSNFYQLWFKRWDINGKFLGNSLSWVVGFESKCLTTPHLLNLKISRMALWALANYTWLAQNYDLEMTSEESVHFQMKYHKSILGSLNKEA